MTLVPKSVTVTSQFKAFGFREGLSSGSELSVTYEVPDGMSDIELRKEMVKKKFVLESMVLRAELGKGMIPVELYEEVHARTRKASEELIHGYDQVKPSV